MIGPYHYECTNTCGRSPGIANCFSSSFSIMKLVQLILFSFASFVLTNPVSASLQQAKDRMSESPDGTCPTSNGDDPSNFEPPLYTESHRPQIHFSPSSGFMNDPNGLVKSGDTWHLFYQYNPTGMRAGNQHWGHASSKDLYSWHNQPIAIYPEVGEAIFSGSAVLDINNTSGFFGDSTKPDRRFVAIYTLDSAEDQNQNLAYSSDGIHYTKYLGNPVLSLNSTQFRDPKVFWCHKSSQWVMAVAHAEDYQVGFYGSPNLRSWTELSRFEPAGRLPASQLECPDLMQLPARGGERDGETAWTLMFSATEDASVLYFTGNWDGQQFSPDHDQARLAAFGKEWYAAQSFSNIDKAIALGWTSNWKYANETPTSPYRGLMSLPRELSLVWLDAGEKGYWLAQRPYNLDSIARSDPKDYSSQAGHGPIELAGEGAFEIVTRFSLDSQATPAADSSAEIQIRDATGEGVLKVGFTFGQPKVKLYIDRSSAGSFGRHNPDFTGHFSQEVPPLTRDPGQQDSDQIVEIQLIVDRSLTEVFAQRGLASSAVLTYWDDNSRPTSASILLRDQRVKLELMQVTAIDRTWPSSAC